MTASKTDRKRRLFKRIGGWLHRVLRSNRARWEDKPNSKFCLWAAGIFSAVMGLFHFFLPYFFPWQQRISEIYPPVQWALFATNFFFSFLLLWGGFLTIIAILQWEENRWLRYSILGGMGLFWVVGALYELVVPFPVAVVRWILPGFSSSVAFLYILAILQSVLTEAALSDDKKDARR